MSARIQIVITDESAPFVTAKIVSLRNGREATVRLIVDTGAFDAVLSLDALRALGLDTKDLKPSFEPIVGFGGMVRSFEMEDVVFVFKCDSGETYEAYSDKVFVASKPEAGVSRKKRMFVPNLLGRAFLEKHRFVLHWDFSERHAYLEIKG